MRPRMSAKGKVWSLQNLCMKSAIKNFMLFSNSSYQFQPKYLPASLRQEILDGLRYSPSLEKEGNKLLAETRGNAIIQLLDHEIKKLKFSCLAYNVENEFGDLSLKMMDAVIEKATGLQEFDASALNHLPRRHFFCNNNRLNKLTQLRSLQVLQIDDLECDNTYLDTFSKNLLNLKVLKINLSKNVTAAGFKCLKNLKKLREFYFRCLKESSYYDINPEVQTKMMSLCLMHLPQLTIVGFSADTIRSADESHHIVRPDMSELSKLECLFVHRQLTAPQAQLLPCVKHLEVKEFLSRPVGNYEWLLSFDKLETLDLKIVKCLDFFKILERVGRTLKRLDVKYVTYGKIDLRKTLGMCPNLERFNIEGAQLELDFDEPVKNIQLPSALSRVAIYSNFCGRARTILPDEFFLQMMSLPLLREVYFCQVMVNNTEEVRRVTEMVEAGSICQQLEVVSMSLPGIPTDMKNLIAFQELIKKLCAFAPKLNFANILDDL